MRNSRVSNCAQDLVNAQTNVNRAVFETNKIFGSRPNDDPDPDYIKRCVIDAQSSLNAVLDRLTPKPRKARKRA